MKHPPPARYTLPLSVALLLALLYTTSPPLNIPLSLLAAGAILGLLAPGPPRLTLAQGAAAGLLGYLMAYTLSGASPLGFSVLSELLGPAGPLIPLIYYPATTSMVALALSLARRRREPTPRSATARCASAGHG